MNNRHLNPVLALLLALAFFVPVVSCSKQSSGNSSTVTPGKPQDISFGRRQIDQMLADRPDMVGTLTDDDPIVFWIVDSMNGGRIGRRIYWNADSPHSSL